MKRIGKGVIKIAIIVIALITMCFSTKVQAAELTVTEPLKVVGSLGEIIGAGKEFISQGQSGPGNVKTSDQFAEELAPIGSIIAGVGIVIFMGVLAVMAIKWIVAKPDDKAKLKQAFVGYVIAAFVFFGAVGIWRLAITIIQSVEQQI